MKFKGVIVDIMCKINNKYKKCVKKLKYGNQKFISEVVKLGFKQNPYDKCTFNAIVNNEQLTEVFYVDNLKALHKDKVVLEKFMNQL